MRPLYRLDAKTDLEAWDTHVIQSHRAKPKKQNPLLRPFMTLTLVAAVGAGLIVSVLPDSQSPRATSVRAVQPTEKAEAPPVSVTDLDADRGAQRAARDRAVRMQPTTPPPSKVDIVIKYALAQVGDRYKWAAAGPNVFDCSGLVLAAFRQVGISLPHYTGAMISKGTRVSKSDMRPGDMVFTASNHVAIYLGNGMMVAASSSAGKVRVQKVYSFYAARRLI